MSYQRTSEGLYENSIYSRSQQLDVLTSSVSLKVSNTELLEYQFKLFSSFDKLCNGRQWNFVQYLLITDTLIDYNFSLIQNKNYVGTMCK